MQSKIHFVKPAHYFSTVKRHQPTQKFIYSIKGEEKKDPKPLNCPIAIEKFFKKKASNYRNITDVLPIKLLFFPHIFLHYVCRTAMVIYPMLHFGYLCCDFVKKKKIRNSRNSVFNSVFPRLLFQTKQWAVFDGVLEFTIFSFCIKSRIY